nr:hypothetical protein [Candidatus Sigynarchaeota archaeon]
MQQTINQLAIIAISHLQLHKYMADQRRFTFSVISASFTCKKSTAVILQGSQADTSRIAEDVLLLFPPATVARAADNGKNMTTRGTRVIYIPDIEKNLDILSLLQQWTDGAGLVIAGERVTVLVTCQDVQSIPPRFHWLHDIAWVLPVRSEPPRPGTETLASQPEFAAVHAALEGCMKRGLQVNIPFRAEIAPVLNPGTKSSEQECNRMLTLIESIALLRHRSRDIYTITTGNEETLCIMPQVEDVRLAIQYARWALPFLVRLQNERLVLQAFTRFQNACISLPEIISFMERHEVSATAANHAINRLRQQGWIARLDPASDLGIAPRYQLVTIQAMDRAAIDKMLDAAGAALSRTEEHVRFVDRNRGSFLQNLRAAIYKAPRGGVQSQKPSGLLSFTDQEEADAIAKGNDIREQKIKEAKPVIKKDLDYVDWLMQNGDFRLAIDIINRVVATDKKNKRALIMSWECQAELGLLPDMLRTLKVLAELDPESHVFVHNLGAGYMVARKWSKAETYLRRAMAISHAPETRAELERIEVLKTAHDTQVPIPFMYIGYAGPLAVFQSRARIF